MSGKDDAWLHFLESEVLVPPGLGGTTLGLLTLPPLAPFIGFLDSASLLQQLRQSRNLVGLITTPELSAEVSWCGYKTMQHSDPRWLFYTCYNMRGQSILDSLPRTSIHPTASIAATANVSEFGVRIGERVQVEHGVCIGPGSIIQSDAILRAGSIVGSPGLEHKRTSRGILTVVHDGAVVIGAGAEIGPGSVISRGILGRDTRIGESVKVDNLVSIAHGASVGNRTFIAAGSVLSGHVRVGEDVWIGPGAVVSNQTEIEDHAHIALGSHVLRNVKRGERWMGPPARPIAHPD